MNREMPDLKFRLESLKDLSALLTSVPLAKVHWIPRVKAARTSGIKARAGVSWIEAAGIFDVFLVPRLLLKPWQQQRINNSSLRIRIDQANCQPTYGQKISFNFSISLFLVEPVVALAEPLSSVHFGLDDHFLKMPARSESLVVMADS